MSMSPSTTTLILSSASCYSEMGDEPSTGHPSHSPHRRHHQHQHYSSRHLQQHNRFDLSNTSSNGLERLSSEEVVMLRQLLQQLQSQQQPTMSLAQQLHSSYRPPSTEAFGNEYAMNPTSANQNKSNNTDNEDEGNNSTSGKASITDTGVESNASTTGDNTHNNNDEESHYDEFPETTHAWAIFADDPKQKTATRFDRAVGCLIIVFQLFTYTLFVEESINDYQSGQVAVTTGHADCLAANKRPDGRNYNYFNYYDDSLDESLFQCEAGFTNFWDAMVAFSMLGIFLAADFIQAARAILNAPTLQGLGFALLAGFEVTWAFIAASIAVSYNLYIGEVTDAVEVGIGLLFVRELSARAYHGIRQKRNRTQNMLTCCGNRDKNSKIQQYKTFFATLTVLVLCGFIMDPICEHFFAVPLQY